VYSNNYGLNYVYINSLIGGESIAIDSAGFIAYAISSTGLIQIILSSKSVSNLNIPYGYIDSANPELDVTISSYNTIIMSSDARYCCFCACSGVIFIRDNQSGALYQTNPKPIGQSGIIGYADLAGSSDLSYIYTISSPLTYSSILYTTNRGGYVL